MARSIGIVTVPPERRFISAASVVCLVVATLGCGGPTVAEPKPAPSKAATPTKSEVQFVAQVPAKKTPAQPATKKADPPKQDPPRRTLADLVPEGTPTETVIDPLRFSSPKIDEAKLAARGIRKLVGKHLTLYTDVAASPAVDELPALFDLAVPQWCEYFEIDAARAANWRMTAALAKEKEKFYGTGLWPDDLPPFLHGFMRDSQFWLYEQPSNYYRRHLLLHEGTHGFMWAFLGGLGAPWYSEGMAELLGTHDWHEGKLRLGVMPANKESVPMWGRVKIIRDSFSTARVRTLREVIDYPQGVFLKTESYGWSWAAAALGEHDPKYRAAFRSLRKATADTGPSFNERYVNQLGESVRHAGEDWQWFITNLDYGYDIERESILRKPFESLPAAGAEVTLRVDRGWQSSGWKLDGGKKYQLSAEGRYQIAKTSKPWMCEPDGVTLRYHNGRPLGVLLAAVTDEGVSGNSSPLLHPTAIGRSQTIAVGEVGVLYLRVNDSPAELADNAGEVRIRIVTAE